MTGDITLRLLIVLNRPSRHNNFTQDSVLLWDGPKGGTLIELWGMKNLRMDEIVIEKVGK